MLCKKLDMLCKIKQHMNCNVFFRWVLHKHHWPHPVCLWVALALGHGGHFIKKSILAIFSRDFYLVPISKTPDFPDFLSRKRSNPRHGALLVLRSGKAPYNPMGVRPTSARQEPVM